MTSTAVAPVPAIPTAGTHGAALRRLRWAWPVAVLLGFPIGGYAGSLIAGPVDAVGPALAAGLISGAIAGAAQLWALRSFVPWTWVPATSVGMAVGLAAGAELVDYGLGRGDLMLMGAITGLGAGGLQALVLARRVPRSRAIWWAVASPPAWALAWLVTSYVISRNVAERFPNFGASGALLFAALTLLLLMYLFRPRPDTAE
jgi:hypothetical protein